ncbi:MAG: hypothetical protein IPI31_08005 [Bacteroidetes bacterium]|nr:hypothetical protein [Bacteroidota bacterium]
MENKIKQSLIRLQENCIAIKPKLINVGRENKELNLCLIVPDDIDMFEDLQIISASLTNKDTKIKYLNKGDNFLLEIGDISFYITLKEPLNNIGEYWKEGSVFDSISVSSCNETGELVRFPVSLSPTI